MSTTGSVPAVGYLRRSTEKQEQSLEDQRREIECYAGKHGYDVLRWYEDDGISGDATEKRVGFQAMHRDACNGADFEAILVWDQDRFGRFNSLEAGYWIHPLVQVGVRLVTVTEGPINWNDFTGRLIYSMKQEGKHQFLVDLSRNTARGQITTAQSGYLNGQRAPYGYDRLLLDEGGHPKQRVADGEQVARPRSWKVTLVPSEDPQKVETAKWLFDTYANQDVGLRSLAEQLNARGVPGPTGGLWWMGSIREILRNPAYCGDLVWARRRMGKYHRVSAGEIKGRTDTGAKVKHNAQEEWIIKEDAFPAIVDRQTWKLVQGKLTERKGRTSSHKKSNRERYLLSGLLYCAHCGRKMHGTLKTRRKRGKEYAWEKYICSTYQTSGTSQGCRHHAVGQKELVALLLTKLRDAVLAGGHKEKLRAKVRERLASRWSTNEAQLDGLQAKLVELDRQIDRGAERLLKAPEDVTDLLAPKLSAWRQERERIAEQLERIGRPARTADLEKQVDAALDHLWTMASELEDAEPARLRELLRRMVSRIDLSFDHVPRGKRIECPLSKGTIALRPDPIFIGLDNRGDRIRTCDLLNPIREILTLETALKQRVNQGGRLLRAPTNNNKNPREKRTLRAAIGAQTDTKKRRGIWAREAWQSCRAQQKTRAVVR